MINPYRELTRELNGRRRMSGMFEEGELRDEFLSEEDLDLQNLSEEELIAYWNLWLEQAQATNDLDEALYSHGVFERDPAVGGDSSERP